MLTVSQTANMLSGYAPADEAQILLSQLYRESKKSPSATAKPQ